MLESRSRIVVLVRGTTTTAAGVAVFVVGVNVAQTLSIGPIFFDSNKSPECCILSQPDVEVVARRVVLNRDLLRVELFTKG
jgi:hypothetical protein